MPMDGSVVADPLRLVGGSSVVCSNGRCGVLGRIIFEPESRSVTHLAVEPAGLTNTNGRLVPIAYVRAVDDAIHLSCSTEEFEGFDPDEINATATSTYATASMMMPRAEILPMAAQVIVHQIPEGEVEVNSEENIVATDGHAGHLLGLSISQDDHRITALLLRVGHLLHKKDVTIPIEMVTGIDDGQMTLSLSKAQVEDFE
jgi:sporulation protein YlmC with PRC-barrel domain